MKVLQFCNAASLKLSLFVKLCKLVGSWGSLPFRWDSSLNSLAPNLKLSGKCQSRICFVLNIFAVSQIVQSVEWFGNGRGSGSTMDNIQIGISLIEFVTVGVHMQALSNKSAEIILYVNGLLRFIKKFPRARCQKRITLIEGLNMFLASGMYLSGIIGTAGLVYALHWNNPCKASLLGYWLLPECSGLDVESTLIANLTKIFVLLGNHFIMCFGSLAITFVVGVLQCLGTMILVDCPKIFWMQMRQENEPRMLQNACIFYRQIQLLGNLNNLIQQRIMTTSMLINGIVCHAFCLTGAILTTKNYVGKQSTISLTFFLTIAIDCLLMIIVMFGGLSNVFKESKISSYKMKQLSCDWKDKGVSRITQSWQIRFFWSCSPVKVKFGSTNFVEELTPLNAINFSLGLVVQLLLLKS